ncbi:unnamed protein product [Fusarium venenatum]|uniref:Uncharacterized protein n=1 Tax=Fusarium venenatum TaxID=56646 RepID=A0A2L2T0D6_9HYPO|nr:uncharacterized protein FVRRES_11170 [Fusarium venenatum]CEI38479.1 unnamed protein product [Fusarium venenatum]
MGGVAKSGSRCRVTCHLSFVSEHHEKQDYCNMFDVSKYSFWSSKAEPETALYGMTLHVSFALLTKEDKAASHIIVLTASSLDGDIKNPYFTATVAVFLCERYRAQVWRIC